MAHDAVVDFARSTSIRVLNGRKRFILVFADNSIFLAHKVKIPVVVLQKLVDANNRAISVDRTHIGIAVIQREEGSFRHKVQRPVLSPIPYNPISSTKLLRLDLLAEDPLILLVHPLQECPYDFILIKEFSDFLKQV